MVWWWSGSHALQRIAPPPHPFPAPRSRIEHDCWSAAHCLVMPPPTHPCSSQIKERARRMGLLECNTLFVFGENQIDKITG